MPSEEVAMEHQFFIRQQNLKLYRSLVAASEAAAAKADARQEKLLKLLAEEVANDPSDVPGPSRTGHTAPRHSFPRRGSSTRPLCGFPPPHSLPFCGGVFFSKNT